MQTGKMKWYNIVKGFGFIAGDDDKDYFVHSSQMPKDENFKEGDPVEFDEKETDKGPQALNVKRFIPDSEEFGE